MRRNWKSLVICLALAVLLIGCPSGGGDDGDGGNGSGVPIDDGGDTPPVSIDLSGNWEGM